MRRLVIGLLSLSLLVSTGANPDELVGTWETTSESEGVRETIVGHFRADGVYISNTYADGRLHAVSVEPFELRLRAELPHFLPGNGMDELLIWGFGKAYFLDDRESVIRTEVDPVIVSRFRVIGADVRVPVVEDLTPEEIQQLANRNVTGLWKIFQGTVGVISDRRIVIPAGVEVSPLATVVQSTSWGHLKITTR